MRTEYLFLHHHVVVEIKGRADDKTYPYLSEHFELPMQTFFIFFEDFDVIVKETDQAQPNRSDQHDDDVHIVQLGQQQRWNNDRGDHDHSSHRGSSLFLLFTGQTQITDGLSYLLPVQNGNDPSAEDQGNDQRK